MKNNIYILVIFILFVALFIYPAMAADSEQNREQQIKAAFIFNFVKFVEWPEEKIAYNNDTIVIGILGRDPFEKAFESIRNKKIKGKKLIIKRFAAFEKIEDKDALKKCHLLFICSSEKEDLPKIVKALNGSPVLTVGETSGLLETGGIINFLVKEEKIHFEINLNASEKAKLKISSKLLRLAERVITEKNKSENADKKNKNKEKPSRKAKE